MASLDDVLKGNLRGYRRETGQPLDEPGIRAAAIPVEEPAIDEVEPPQLYDERAEYRGFKVPAGMDAEQTEKWFGAIDAREDEREERDRQVELEIEEAEAESGFTTQLLGSLERTVMKDNPRMGAKAIEGLGRVAGSDAMIDFGEKTAAEFDASDDPAAFSPRIESIYDAEGFQDYIDYAGSTLGQGLGSIGTMAAGGAVGAVAGAPFGASGVTARVGAVATGFMMNYGDLYDTFVEQEGMDPDDAAKYAIAPAAVMAGLDTFGLEKLVKPARDALSKNFAKRTAQLAIRGGGTEAVTEAAQQIVQEAAGELAEVTGLATEDIEFGQRLENVVNAIVGGFIPGFAIGGTGAARVRPEDDAPVPPAAPEPTVLTRREDVPAEVPDAATAGVETESEVAEAARLWQELGIESPYFKRKFGNTKVVDDDGKPLAVFHGTSGDFNEFKPGAADNYFGSAIYTSSSVDDVNANYATAEGPDIKARVEEAIDRIDSLDDFDDDDILDAAKRYMDRTESTDTELLEAIKAGDVEKLKDELEPDLIEQLARQQVLGDEAFSVLKTYINIENPVYLDPSGTKGRTTFDLEIEYDDDGNVVDESGSVIDLLEAIDEVADDLSTYQIGGRGPYSDDVDKLKTFIGENSIDGEIDALDIFKEVRGGSYYFESDTGGLENTEFIRKVFEKMGFDGIVADAYHFFGDRKAPMGVKIPAMAGVTPGTYHYMAFKPEQIKSATGNVGTFDPSGNILKSTAAGREFVGLGGLSVDQAIAEMSKIKTGEELINFIIDRADNPSYREIAERIRPHVLDVGVYVLTGDMKDLPADMLMSMALGTLDHTLQTYLLDMGREKSFGGIRGMNVADKLSNDVILRGRPVYSGANAETALHELVHAATQARLNDGLLKGNRGTDVAKAAEELLDLGKQVERIIRKRRKKKKVDPEFDSILERGLENVHEFVAYGMTNKKFQEFLMTIGSKNKNLWNAFVDKIANLLGIGKDKRSVLTDLIRVTDELLTADLGQLHYRDATEHMQMDQRDSPDNEYVKKAIEKRAIEASQAGIVSAEEALDAYSEWVEKGTESSYFKKWFGDSVMTDSQGRPIRVFHGTPREFEAFQITGDRVGLHGQGVYSSLNAELASSYAAPALNPDATEIVGPPGNRYVSGGNVIPAYVSISNPIFTDNAIDMGIVQELNDWMSLYEYGSIEIPSDSSMTYEDVLNEIADLAFDPDVRRPSVRHASLQRELKKILEKYGYDGVIATDSRTFEELKQNDFKDAPRNMHIVAFSPNDMKSDIANLGTYTREDPRISFMREDVDPAAPVSDIVSQQASEGQQYVGLSGLSVEEAIEASKSINTGVELAEFIIENADNKDYKEIAKRLIPHLEDTDVHTLTGDVSDIPQWVFESEKKGTLERNIVNSLAGMSAHHTRLRYAVKGLNISRPGDPYNDVFIRGRPVYSGATAETMLHELIHAATVRRQADGNLADNEGTKLQKASSKIIQLRNDVVQVAKKAQRDGSLDSDMESILVRATENDKEFIAYGMTNKKFQEFLMTIKSKNKSIWNRFVEAVAGLLGISKDKQNALSDLILATDELLSAPLDEVPLRPMTESIQMMSEPVAEAAAKSPAPAAAKEEGNPVEEIAPMTLSERSYSPMDSITTYTDDVNQSKAEFDRRREVANQYEPMLFELMKMEADFYEMDEDSDKAKELGAQYEGLLKQYAKIDDDLLSDEYDRFLKGSDYYYETSEEGIENFDVDRAFNVMNTSSDIEMDIDLRTTQEMMQRKRFDRMVERGGTLVDLAGQNSAINRLIVQKANSFNHPVQTVQLNESDKMALEKDLSNVEELKEDGLISYLLYKELKGDVMLF